MGGEVNAHRVVRSIGRGFYSNDFEVSECSALSAQYSVPSHQWRRQLEVSNAHDGGVKKNCRLCLV